MSKYRTIVCDPPWRTTTGPMSGGGMAKGFIGGDGRSRPLRYPTMHVRDIAALPVDALADDDAHLYLWTTNGYLRRAFDVVRAWRFNFSTLLVWSKAPMGGGLGSDAFGISAEYILFARRGTAPAQHRFRQTVFTWKRSYDARGKPQHSAKPPEFIAEVVEQVSPGPYLELFSRAAEPRDGWHYHGDESLGTAQLPEQAAPTQERKGPQ